jgi:hypothetical protein
MKISKEMWAISLGPVTGILVPVALRQYIEPNYGTQVPGINSVIPAPWSNWSVFVPIVAGAVFVALPFVVKSKKLTTPVKYFLGTSGITMLVSGVVNGIFATPTARARTAVRTMAQPVVRTMGSPAQGLTPTGISGKIIYS